MTQVNRRSALSVGLAAMAAFVAAASAYAQRQLPPGISLQAWGKRESMIPVTRRFQCAIWSINRVPRLPIHPCPMTWSATYPRASCG